MLVFKLHESVWELSMVRISYKLTKRTTKTEKIEKPLKIFKIYNFVKLRTARYKLTARVTSFIQSSIISL